MEKWVGSALIMMGLIHLISAIVGFWVLAILSSISSALPPEYEVFNKIAPATFLFALFIFFTALFQ